MRITTQKYWKTLQTPPKAFCLDLETTYPHKVMKLILTKCLGSARTTQYFQHVDLVNPFASL